MVLEIHMGPPEHLDGLPSTMQYNALLTPSDHSVEVAVAQGVLPGRADRFSDRGGARPRASHGWAVGGGRSPAGRRISDGLCEDAASSDLQ